MADQVNIRVSNIWYNLLDRYTQAEVDALLLTYATDADLAAHAADLALHLTADQNDAVDGAASPSAVNVFATMSDVGAGGGGDMSRAVYDADLDNIVDRAEQLEGPALTQNISTAADVRAHLDSLTLHITSEQNDALDGANTPSVGNVFATMADLPAGGGDMLKSVYDVDDDGITDRAEQVEGPTVGANISTAAQIRTHLDSTANPHTVTAAQAGAEPDLSNPASDGHILYSTALGVRSWGAPPVGDMEKSVYDSDGDGISDASEQLEGPGAGQNISTATQVRSHLDSTALHITADQNDALDGAAAPSSINVFATMADVVVGAGDMLKSIYDTDDDGLVDAAEQLEGPGASLNVSTAAEVRTHLDSTSNPHSVTAAQAGADPTGSAAAVQSNLDTHEADVTNPHSVTAAQSGAEADLGNPSINGNVLSSTTLGVRSWIVPNPGDMEKATYDSDGDGLVDASEQLEGPGAAQNISTAAQVRGHLDSSANPHSVTAAQAGADPAGSASAVQSNLTAHEADQNNPHSVTAVQAGAEPGLGNPASNGYVLSSTTIGTRSWVAQSGGIPDAPSDGTGYLREDAAWVTGVRPADYASATVGGTARFRLDGTTLYISTTATPP